MYDEYLKILKERLDERRYIHSLNVASKARELAERYGADADKAYLAGLLHDICKNDSQEKMLQIFTEFGIILDKVQLVSKKLWHAIAGAAYIEHYLNINDRELLDAVRYHTTSRENATLMDKILYIADYVSDERDFDGVDELRAALNQSLELCYKNALTMSIAELSEIQRPIHADTFSAYNSVTIE